MPLVGITSVTGDRLCFLAIPQSAIVREHSWLWLTQITLVGTQELSCALLLPYTRLHPECFGVICVTNGPLPLPTIWWPRPSSGVTFVIWNKVDLESYRTTFWRNISNIFTKFSNKKNAMGPSNQDYCKQSQFKMSSFIGISQLPSKY